MEAVRGRTFVPDLQRNKETVAAYLDLALIKLRLRARAERYAGGAGIRPIAHEKDGRGGFKGYFAGMRPRFPGKRGTNKRTRMEGTFAILPYRRKRPGDDDRMAIDPYRSEDAGRVVAHRDVRQIAPQNSTNPNGMF